MRWVLALLSVVLLFGCTGDRLEKARGECNAINDEELRLACNLSVAQFSGDSRECSKVPNESTMDCYVLMAALDGQNICKNSPDKDGCYESLARFLGDENICNGIEGENKTLCVLGTNSLKGDPGLCDRKEFETTFMGDTTFRELCEEATAKVKETCEKATSTEAREYCLGNQSKASIGTCRELEALGIECGVSFCYQQALLKNRDPSLCIDVPEPKQYYEALCYAYVIKNKGGTTELCTKVSDETYGAMCRAVGIATGR